MIRKARAARSGIVFSLAIAVLGTPVVVSAAPLSADQAHINAIESAILPAVTTKGVPTPTATLAERMAVDKVPGLSIAYFHDGKIAWARGYGVADAAGRPVTPETLFQAASISKPVTAMTAMKLVQAGKLDLDADVNRYLNIWKVPVNPLMDAAPVTLRELLSHTAGLSVHGFAGYAPGQPIPTLVQVLDGAPPANSPAVRIEARPGTAFRYSSGGYVVAQQLMQDVASRPFAELARDLVLRPTGMSHSFFGPLSAATSLAAAAPFDQAGSPLKEGAHVYPEQTAAGLWTTPSDLARYAIAMQGALAGKSAMIRQDLAREMVTRADPGAGIGWELSGSADYPYFYHGGVNAGFQSHLTAYNGGDGVAMMTNSDNGIALTIEVLRTIAHEYGWPDLQPVERTPITLDTDAVERDLGQFQTGRYAYVTLAKTGDEVVLTDADGSRHPLLPSSAAEWFFREENATVDFQGGAADRLILTRFGVITAGVRVSDEDAARGREELAAKFREQSKDPQSETDVRAFLDAFARGAPNYARMTPALAATVRDQLPDASPFLARLGAIKSLAFKGVGPGGRDIYDVAFAGGGHSRSTRYSAATGLPKRSSSSN